MSFEKVEDTIERYKNNGKYKALTRDKTQVTLQKGSSKVSFDWDHTQSLRNNLTRVLKTYEQYSKDATSNRKSLVSDLKKLLGDANSTDADLYERLFANKFKPTGWDGKDSILYHVQVMARYDNKKQYQKLNSIHDYNDQFGLQITEAKERQLKAENAATDALTQLHKVTESYQAREKQMLETQQSLQNEITSLNRRIENLGTLAKQSQEAETAQVRLHQSKLQDLEDKRRNLEQRLEDLTTQINSQKISLEQKETKIQELQTNLDQSGKTLRAYEKREDLVIRSNIPSDQLPSYSNQELQRKIVEDKKTRKTTHTKNVITRLRTEINVLNEVNQQQQQTIVQLNDQVTALKEINTNLAQKMANKENQQMDSEQHPSQDQLKKEIDMLGGQFEQALHTKDDEIARLGKKVSTLQDEVAKKSHEIDRLRKIIQKVAGWLSKILGSSVKSVEEEIKPGSKVNQKLQEKGVISFESKEAEQRTSRFSKIFRKP